MAPLNKTSTRYYWELFLAQKHIPRSLFFDEPLTIQQKQNLFKQFVCIVNIETSAYCNRKCIYCPISINNSRKQQFYINSNTFDKVINELTYINYGSTIVFNLYNEPLADEHIYQRIKQARKALPQAFLMFNSNGDYITADKLDKLTQAGLNALFVTLHPSHKQQYVIGDRLKHFDKFFKHIGLSDYQINESSETGHIEVDIDWQGMRLRVMANDWAQYGNSRAGAIDFLNPTEHRISPCVRPLREFTMDYEGKVFPCCQFFPESENNQKYQIDDVSVNSIFDIYASQALTQWRKHLFLFGEKSEPCGVCWDEDFSKPDPFNARKAILNRLERGN